MVIYYEWGTKYKFDKDLEPAKCENCSHVAPRQLVKKKFIVKIFFIPVFSMTKKKGIMCDKCGYIQKLDSSEYNEIKKCL